MVRILLTMESLCKNQKHKCNFDGLNIISGMNEPAEDINEIEPTEERNK